jgi:hypothetical protein
LNEVAATVEILSPTRYTFRGELRDLARANGTPISETGHPVELPAGEGRLLAYLESELYQRLYRRPIDGVGRSMVRGGADHELLRRLGDANSGWSFWEPGWRVVGELENGRLPVRRAEDPVVAWTQEANVRMWNGTEARPDTPCRVRVPAEIRHRVLGYYLAFGEADPPEPMPPIPTVRLYWNLVDAEAAVTYIARATEMLNREGLSFRTKVIGHSQLYLNADAGVLYMPRTEYRRAQALISALHDQLAGTLRPEVPLFTLRLRPGLGIAEDPLDGTSFGQSRCQLAARGLWRAHRLGAADEESRATALAEQFVEEGFDPRRPHLSPGSDDFDPLDG